MNHDAIWAIAVAILGLGGYAYGWRSHPIHRKGCNECDADVRRAEERQRELNHTYHHENGFGNCPDAKCPQNKPEA